MTPTGPSRTLPVVEAVPPRRGPDRRADRRLTYLGLTTAIAFLVAALVSVALPPSARLAAWLPLHLVLAGAVGTAIAAMLPFFVAALAVATPAPAALRAVGLTLVAGGALAAMLGRVSTGGGVGPLAAGGAAAYVAGMAAVGVAAAIPLRRTTGPRRPATELAYAVALLDVMVGVSLVALLLAGEPTVTANWAALKVAHAWLNVLGFVTLAVAGTLVHFVPTVVGSRIRQRRSGGLAIAFLALAAPLAAVGYALGPGGPGEILVWLGVATAIAGAAALIEHGLLARRDRARWTSDADWHRFTGGSLVVAPGWLLVAALVAALGVLDHGADPQGWRLDRIGVPLVLGFVVQVLLGSLSHLLPAIGPGTPEAHAAQRRLLGRGGSRRLVAWNAGVAILAAGLIAGSDGVALVGFAIALASGATTLLLLGLALRTR